MKKGIALILLVLLGFKVTAQIPRTLQIGVTNGTVTVASQTSPTGQFFGLLETTTNLSPPIAWKGIFSNVLMPGVSSNFPATNPQTFFRLLQFYPVFEFAIFYNLNMETDPGQPMIINGPVFSNAGIWAGTANLTFNSTVSAVGQVDISSSDPFATSKVDNNAPPNFNLVGQPTSGGAPLYLQASITNAEALLNIPPPAYAMGTVNAFSTTGIQYLANAADLVISNSVVGTNILGGGYTPKGTNITIYYQDPLNAPILTKLTPDFYILKTPAKTGLYTNYVSPNLSDTNRCYTNVSYAGWSFVTNVAFYDYRESKTVQAVQIDVAKFNVWLTNSIATNGGSSYNVLCLLDKGHPIDSIWTYNSVPLTSSQLPAVRLIHGQQLGSPYGFTIATPMPIYVYGDYNKQTDSTHVSSGTNTLYTYPAALMGDAVTILSSNWNDAYNASTPLPFRTSINTTVNAAMLEGIVQSTNVSGTDYYSGGVENFLRLLEDWNNSGSAQSFLTFNGSIVVMFPSIYATGFWNNHTYSIPVRNWGFDYNFLQQTKLPPLTPLLVNIATP